MKRLLMVGVVATLMGCQSMGPKETLGTGVGALVGGVVGNQFGGGSGRAVFTTAGVFLGGMMGRDVGKSLDAVDRSLARQSVSRSLEYSPNNTKTSWQNPNTGNSGYTIPTNTYQVNNVYCREYHHVMKVAGKRQQVYGTACRQPDGTWQTQ